MLYSSSISLSASVLERNGLWWARQSWTRCRARWPCGRRARWRGGGRLSGFRGWRWPGGCGGRRSLRGTSGRGVGLRGYGLRVRRRAAATANMTALAVVVILSLDVDQGCDLRVRVGDGVADGRGAWLAGMVSGAGSLPESGLPGRRRRPAGRVAGWRAGHRGRGRAGGGACCFPRRAGGCAGWLRRAGGAGRCRTRAAGEPADQPPAPRFGTHRTRRVTCRRRRAGQGL